MTTMQHIELISNEIVLNLIRKLLNEDLINLRFYCKSHIRNTLMIGTHQVGTVSIKWRKGSTLNIKTTILIGYRKKEP